MNEGRIQQVGSPMDVYRAPRTRFVAEFVGTNNIIDGVVSARAAEAADGGTDAEASWLVETALGPLVSANPSGAEVAAGDRVHLVVSSDLLAVNDSAAEAAANAITARLVGESFVGNVVTLVLEAGGRTGTEGSVAATRLAGLGAARRRRGAPQLRPARHADHSGNLGQDHSEGRKGHGRGKTRSESTS